MNFYDLYDISNQTHFPYKPTGLPRIPFITHRIWVTNPNKPREMKDMGGEHDIY
jgi:hypothetical protein